MEIIVSKIKQRTKTVEGIDVTIGTVFTGSVNGYGPSTYLRANSSVVDLKNPGIDWTIDYSIINIEDYEEVTAKLLIEEKDN